MPWTKIGSIAQAQLLAPSSLIAPRTAWLPDGLEATGPPLLFWL
jgi:hypothetical protein